MPENPKPQRAHPCHVIAHELKTWPLYYAPIVHGRKTFEIRENDRDFQVTDVLFLREYDEVTGYTGRTAIGIITYITDFAQKPGFVVMGFHLVDQA